MEDFTLDSENNKGDGKGDDISGDRDGKTKLLVRSACQLYMQSREEMAWLEKKF